MAEPVVLVLGCGVGGVTAARELRRLLPAPHRVLAIDRDAQASLPATYLSVVTGERRPESVRRRRSLLSRSGIEFANADIRQVDISNRYVRAGSREFYFDYLVVALGAEAALDSTPGLSEAAHHFYTLEAAERLAANLRYFPGGKVAIVVAGDNIKSPAAPYEAAMMLEHYFHSRRMRQKIEIDVYAWEESPLEFAGAEASETLLGLLAHKGIGYHSRKRVALVDPVQRELTFSDGDKAGFQLLMAIPETRAPAVVREAGLVDESGWVSVDPVTMETAFSSVYAIGDIIRIERGDGGQMPKLGTLASKQALVAARNVAHSIIGRASRPDSFEADGRVFIDVGGGAAAVAEGDFLAPGHGLGFKQPSILWHWAKLAQERYWLWRTYGK